MLIYYKEIYMKPTAVLARRIHHLAQTIDQASSPFFLYMFAVIAGKQRLTTLAHSEFTLCVEITFQLIIACSRYWVI